MTFKAKQTRFKVPPIIRFYRMVDTHNQNPDVCWEWLGADNGKGYGKFFYYGKLVYAHRAAYMMKWGEIPAGMVVMNTCDNPCCVNPAHLKAVTKSENLKDAAGKGRLKPPILTGEMNGNSKLTEAKVIGIKIDLLNGLALAFVANKYGTVKSNISSIKNGHTWKGIGEAA